MSHLFASSGQSIGVSASASVLPMTMQDWFPLGLTPLIFLQPKGLLQRHSSKASILQCSAFFTVQLSHPYMITGKTIALTRRNFVSIGMSLLFNMLSRLFIAFLPRSEHLLNFMAAFTIYSDLEPKKKKLCYCFHCFPVCLPWSGRTGCHDLSFLNVEF